MTAATVQGRRPDGRSGTGAVLVVMPARDEADRVHGAVRAIAVAARFVDVDVVLVVVDNDSRDATAQVARRALRRSGLQGAVLASAARSIGRARHDGVVGARTLGLVDDERRWRLLSTDADTVVPATWIADHLAHADAGAVAVAGSVRLRDDDDAVDVRAAWWDDYGATLQPGGSHPHVHAANLSVDLAAYDRVGGFPDQPRAEDIGLWTRLRSAGIRPVADHRVRVDTSARRDARCPGGFAHALYERYRS